MFEFLFNVSMHVTFTVDMI